MRRFLFLALGALLVAAPGFAQAQTTAPAAKRNCPVDIETFRQQLKSRPADFALNHNMGWCLNELGRYSEAIAYLQVAIQAMPKSSATATELAYAYLQLKDYDRTIAWGNKALESNPANSVALSRLGHAYYFKGNHEQAVGWYNKAIAAQPQPFLVHHRLGYTLNVLHRHGEALVAIDEALRLDPRSVNSWLEQGFAYEHLDRLDEAIASYSRAMALDPKDLVPLNSIAKVHRDLKKDCAAAAAWYQKSLALKPGNPIAGYGTGYCLNQAGNFAEAIRYLDMSVRSDPSYATAHAELGYSHYMLENLALAEASLKRALALSKGNVSARFYLGLVYLAKGDRAGAALMAGELRTLKPDLAADLQKRLDGK